MGCTRTTGLSFQNFFLTQFLSVMLFSGCLKAPNKDQSHPANETSNQILSSNDQPVYLSNALDISEEELTGYPELRSQCPNLNEEFQVGQTFDYLEWSRQNAEVLATQTIWSEEITKTDGEKIWSQVHILDGNHALELAQMKGQATPYQRTCSTVRMAGPRIPGFQAGFIRCQSEDAIRSPWQNMRYPYENQNCGFESRGRVGTRLSVGEFELKVGNKISALQESSLYHGYFHCGSTKMSGFLEVFTVTSNKFVRGPEQPCNHLLNVHRIMDSNRKTLVETGKRVLAAPIQDEE